MGIEVQVKVYRFGNDGFVFKNDGFPSFWSHGILVFFWTLLVLAWWKVILLSVVYMYHVSIHKK